MKLKRFGIAVLLLGMVVQSRAGDLNVVGNLNVASNLTAGVLTLRGATDLSTPVLDFAQPGLLHGTLFFYYNQFDFGECCYQDGADHHAWYKIQKNAANEKRVVALFHYNSNIPPLLGNWKWRVRMYDCLHLKGKAPAEVFSKCGEKFFYNPDWKDPETNPNGTLDDAVDCRNCVEAN